jgi:hypothetical protein
VIVRGVRGLLFAVFAMFAGEQSLARVRVRLRA